MSSRIQCLCFFWPVAYRRCSDDLSDRCSEFSSLMPAIPFQLNAAPCRGEYDFYQLRSLMTTTLCCHRCESAWSVLLEADHWLEFLRRYFVRYIELDACFGVYNAVQWAWHLWDLSDIDMTETSCKSSSSLGCMPCINDLEKSWYFSLLLSWLATFLTEW
jgi:hypothetical protein